MKRAPLIFIVALALLAGGLVAAGATLRERDEQLRGYSDPTQDADLPYRIPRLGVNADLSQYDDIPAQLDLMEAAHLNWVRQPFRWDMIEPQRGQFDWTQADAIIESFEDRDIELVALLVNAPAWARPEGTTLTHFPTDPAYFADFAAAFAARYGHIVDAYQIWDEPNLTAAWGMTEPRPVEYVALLRAGYDAIHAADAGAAVIAAALAPTTENNLNNISDIEYLRAMYSFGAADAMDAVAAKPYGFSLPPDDRTVAMDTLNFSRIVALREVMQANGDGKKPLWASEWGWNSLPPDWTGAPSIWGQVDAETRVRYTLAALDRAEREWPWLGGMILSNWQPTTPPDNPLWGFALIDSSGTPTPLYEALAARQPSPYAANGLYHPVNPYTRYSGVWTFGELGADIGWVQDSQLEFDFAGTDAALLLRQDDALAFLYVTVDGQQANATPRDSSGNSFISLRSDSLLPEIALAPVSRDLPDGTHTLHLVADRGWDRWALAGFAVSSGDLAAPYNAQIAVALLTVAASAVGVVVAALQIDWKPLAQRTAGLWSRLSEAGQFAISAATSVALMIGMFLTWSEAVPALFRREPVQLGLALLTAGLLYVQPHVLLTIAAAAALFVIFYHRPSYALILTVFFAPFFLFPINLWRFAFPMSEMLMLISGAAWVLRALRDWGAHRQAKNSAFPMPTVRPTALDWGVLVYLLLGFVALLWAEYLDPAATELRVLFLEPALFYLILRTTRLERRDLLRLVDALVLAGVVVSVVGLFLYFRGEAVITAEAGARRLASVYGSPNNVGLWLGRCIPFALAFVLAPVGRRRLLALAALLVMGVALVLSQSAGALFIGVPAAVVGVLLFTYGRRALLPLAGLGTVGAVLTLVALRFERFARLLEFDEGTTFFRLRVWESAIQIIRERPITGLGLDQFLYFFQGRYMMPDAWQEPYLSHPHNIILDFWTRLGVLGVALLLWTQAAFWRAGLAIYRSLRGGDPVLLALVIGVMGCMINTLAHGLVDNSIFVQDLIYVYMLLLGIIGQLRSKDFS